ncbi:hypothetical protein D3C73_941940 [compost metagenome]
MKREDDQILEASLEDLLESLATPFEAVQNEEAPLDTLEPAMESLISVTKGILGAGSISKSDAASLQSMTASLEGFQDTFSNLPLSSYTELPSKVNYNASMESVIGAAVRKIIEMIKALIKWAKEKGRAFMDLLRNDRVKVKQTEEAAKKVDKALEVAEVNAAGKGEKEPTRKPGTVVNLEVKSMAMELSTHPVSVSQIKQEVKHIVNELAGTIRYSTTTKGVIGRLQSLSATLFDEPTSFTEGPEGSEVAALTRAIVARMSEEMTKTETLSTTEPETELRMRANKLRFAGAADLVLWVMMPMSQTIEEATAQLTKVEQEITEKANKVEGPLADSDELVTKARRCRAVIQAVDDLQAIKRSVAGAYTSLLQLGAKVAADPNHGVAA